MNPERDRAEDVLAEAIETVRAEMRNGDVIATSGIPSVEGGEDDVLGQYAPSPVPGDADLWSDELPFTAWGQYGPDSLDLRVFEQDVYWVDRQHTPHLVADMSAEYIAAVIGFLSEDAEYFHRMTIRKAAIEIVGDALIGQLPAELLAVAAGGPRLSELTPRDWLEATPLMRSLRRRQVP